MKAKFFKSFFILPIACLFFLGFINSVLADDDSTSKSAQGNRVKHEYHYYPSSKVYHDADRGLYFYLQGSDLEVGTTLPQTLKDGLGTPVILEMETDKPYIFHPEHLKSYYAKQLKRQRYQNLAKITW